MPPIKRLSDIDFQSLTTNRSYFPSPAAWEDEVLYFMMLDRFSDGRETGFRDNNGDIVTQGTTPPFQEKDRGNATTNNADRQKWYEAGAKYVGGNLKGLESKIGYLKRLGVTAIWISPIFKQVAFEETYHGYGIQDFLDVDPNFGSREDLISLVNTAHEHGLRIVLDIILNHSGNVFGYDPKHFRCDDRACWQSDGYVYPTQGFRNAFGEPVISMDNVDGTTHPNDAIWPEEFQNRETFTRRGEITNFDWDPEFREGDFFSLKDIHLGQGSVEQYRPSKALWHLCQVYQYWIALTDIDGFRVDTVKHMDSGAARLFTSVIHEFCESIGKENFYLIGEITGGRTNAFKTLEEVGMDAALGINDIPDKLEYVVKGYRNPEDYFNLFRNSILVQKNSHVWFKDRVVTTFDDHDQVRKGNNKARFCYSQKGEHDHSKMLLNVLALQTFSMGIPCIYYGTEQCFDGHGENDRLIRESMFGGNFGAFETRGVHFFSESTFVFQELSKILNIRKSNIVVRRGRQYLLKISGDGIHFGVPRMLGGEIRSIVPWARRHGEREVLLAINTDYNIARTAWVRIDQRLHKTGDQLRCLYSTNANQIDSVLEVEDRGDFCVRMEVPAAGFVIYE